MKPKLLTKLCHNTKGGYIALMTTILVSALTVSLVSVSLFGATSNSLAVFAQEQMRIAHALADACAEVALEEIRESTSFSGTGTLNFDRGSCNYSVQSTGAQNRIIEAKGVVGTITRTVEVRISNITPSIAVEYWALIN